MNCLLRNEYESDLHNNEQYLNSSNNNAWKKIQVRAAPVQCSTKWANKPIES